MKKEMKEYFAKIGAKGGKKSRRSLSSEDAKAMVEIREKKRKDRGGRCAGRADKRGP
jgi:hypothetical protein